MGVLSGYEPAGVLRFFEEICSIPHGSGNTKKLSDHLVKFAQDRGLRYRQDDLNNVIIWKDGTKGYENSAPVILQGHMDMVAVKEEGCPIDLENDGLELEVLEGDLISAKGTSLGGDNGIAVAMTLAILDSHEIEHPPLEAVFTVDEETGMFGADYLDVSDLKGRLFMNMDSEDEGVFTVSCAGGARATAILPFETESLKAVQIDVRLDGFRGGHSGVEINKGRLNANLTLGRILFAAECDGVRLVSLAGGEKDNAIATYAQAQMAVIEDQVEAAVETMQKTFDEIRTEYASVDPDIRLQITVGEEQKMTCMTAYSTAVILTSLLNLPNGIQRMNPDMPGMVQTSLNLGVMKTVDGEVRCTYAVRSSSESEKEFLIDRIHSIAEIFDGSVEVVGRYPGWEYNPVSRLRDVMIEAHKEQYGKEPVVEGIHAGLECGLFASKLPGLDAISFGPQMQNVHTFKEVLSISSTLRTFELTVRALKKLK